MLGLLLVLAAQLPPDSGSVSDTALASDTTVSDPAQSDTVYYGGSHVIFLAKTEEVVLLESAWVRYRDMTVFSDSIHYDIKLHRLAAHADVLFISGNQRITGNELHYDIDSRKGMMRNARTRVENGFFWAREVWLVEERVLNAQSGYYTTCDRDHPHYSFFGPRVKLLMDDIAITQPVLLRLGSVPVLAAPFWLVPVASKRKSGLMPFKVGNSQDQGWYAKNIAYYWVINDYADATVFLDIMTRKGVQPRLEAVYVVDPLARGSVQGSYIQESDTRARRYSFNASHFSEFLFESELTAQAEFQSDSRYVPEYGEDRLDWLKQELFSYAEVNRRIRRVGSFSAQASRRTDFARHESRTTLPSATIGFGARPLPFGWEASPGVSFSNDILTLADSANKDTATDVDRQARARVGLSSPDYSLGPAGELRVSHDVGLTESRSYTNSVRTALRRRLNNSSGLETSQKPFGILATFQSISVNQTNHLVGTYPPETEYSGQVSANMPLFRVFGVEAIGIHGILHTARPTVSLSYQPEVDSGPIIHSPRLFSPERANLGLTLINGFEAKVGPLKTKADLGRINLGTSYDLKDERFAPLRADAGLLPLQSVKDLRLQLDAAASFDIESLKLRDDYELNTVLNWDKSFRTRSDTAQTSLSPDSTRAAWPGPDSLATDTVPDSLPAAPAELKTTSDWRITLSLNHTFGKDRNMLTGSVSFSVPGWKLSLNSLGYNFVDKKLTNYSITLWRDLHCWEALVNFDRLGDRWKYDFEFRIKQLPDVKFGKSTFRTFLPGVGED